MHKLKKQGFCVKAKHPMQHWQIPPWSPPLQGDPAASQNDSLSSGWFRNSEGLVQRRLPHFCQLQAEVGGPQTSTSLRVQDVLPESLCKKKIYLLFCLTLSCINAFNIPHWGLCSLMLWYDILRTRWRSFLNKLAVNGSFVGNYFHLLNSFHTRTTSICSSRVNGIYFKKKKKTHCFHDHNK